MAEIAGKGEEPSPTVSLDVLKISGVEHGRRRRQRARRDARAQDARPAARREAHASSAISRRRFAQRSTTCELTIILGAVLTILIIYLFLNSWRSTVITGLTLPVSIISAFFIMWVFNFTLNTMTLLALSLAIGLLIDDAIVVRENIVRHLEMGKDHYTAAKEGTDEIGLAVAATSLAVVAVFFPVAFMGGMIGKHLHAVRRHGRVRGARLAVRVVHARPDALEHLARSRSRGRTVARPRHDQRRRNPIRRFAFAFNGWFERVADHYPNCAQLGAQASPRSSSASRRASIVAAFVDLPKLGFTWMPDADTAARSPSASERRRARRCHTRSARAARSPTSCASSRKSSSRYLSVGGGGLGGGGLTTATCTCGSSRSAERAQPVRHPDTTCAASCAQSAERPSDDSGPDEHLRRPRPADPHQRAGAGGVAPQDRRGRVLEAVRAVPGVAEPNSSDEGDIPQLDVRVDRQEAWRAGLGINVDRRHAAAAVRRPARHALGRSAGISSTTSWSCTPTRCATSAADVANIVIPSTNVRAPASRADDSAVAGRRSARRRRAAADRAAQARAAGVDQQPACCPGFAMGDVANDVKQAIDALGLPPGYHFVFGGDVQNLDETKGYVLEALLPRRRVHLPDPRVAVRLVPPAAGDHARAAAQLHRRGARAARHEGQHQRDDDDRHHHAHGTRDEERHSARSTSPTSSASRRHVADGRRCSTAARIRLRPIIMTTVAMIFGMIPLALAIGEGAEQRAPMARAVIGGLITSTLLTLFVVPVMYTLLDDLAAFVMKRSRSHVPTGHGVPLPGPVAGD